MYKILIVEDDVTISSHLAGGLAKWGFEASAVTDFNQVMACFQKEMPHLVLLDISLPFYNGYYWCTEIRKVSKVPILFLSSHADNMDIIMAMDLGGDEYITKPFSNEVLIAKVNALLRRVYSYYGETVVLSAGGAILNIGDCTLQIASSVLNLTKNELRVLKLLMENKNFVVSREKIMQALWEDESFIDDNTLTVNINRLRKKLAGYGMEEFIMTKKGLGYMIHD